MHFALLAAVAIALVGVATSFPAESSQKPKVSSASHAPNNKASSTTKPPPSSKKINAEPSSAKPNKNTTLQPKKPTSIKPNITNKPNNNVTNKPYERFNNTHISSDHGGEYRDPSLDPFSAKYNQKVAEKKAKDEAFECPAELKDPLFNAINALREKNVLLPLKRSNILDSYTQSWADYLASRNQFLHQPYNRYGHDLIYSYRGKPGTPINTQEVIDFFVNLYGIAPDANNEFENDVNVLFYGTSKAIGFGCAASPQVLSPANDPQRTYDPLVRYYVVLNVQVDRNATNIEVPPCKEPTTTPKPTTHPATPTRPANIPSTTAKPKTTTPKPTTTTTPKPTQDSIYGVHDDSHSYVVHTNSPPK